jgi:hypothetical protein
MGVVAPNGVGLPAFRAAIKAGKSGIRFDSQLEELQFSCQIAGKPDLENDFIARYFSALELRNYMGLLRVWTPGKMRDWRLIPVMSHIGITG